MTEAGHGTKTPKKNIRVFVTGGAGYIGSHTVVKLLEAGNQVCVYDNFSNSSPAVLDRVQKLAQAKVQHVIGDIRNEGKLYEAIRDFRPDVVIHFAGLKAVGEAASVPLKYYDHNVSGSVSLLKAMDRAGCDRIVFSSSATVYGVAAYLPFDEDHPLSPTNAYGRTKLYIEGIISDWAASKPDTSCILLRYFNPVGAHPSGMIGEDPSGIPNNLMPFLSQVAVGRRARLSVFGDSYDTRDGTGERDYIHVEDLADAHLAAAGYCGRNRGCEAINVGTGKGVTVLEMVHAFEKYSGRKIPYEITDPRSGDVASSVADVSKASRLLNWQSRLGLEEMCQSSWNWQKRNPDGYQ